MFVFNTNIFIYIKNNILIFTFFSGYVIIYIRKVGERNI